MNLRVLSEPKLQDFFHVEADKESKVAAVKSRICRQALFVDDQNGRLLHNQRGYLVSLFLNCRFPLCLSGWFPLANIDGCL